MGFKFAFQVFQVTVQVSNGTFLNGLHGFQVCLSGVSGDRLHAFQVFQVTVQVSAATFLNDFGVFQVSGESGVYNTLSRPQVPFRLAGRCVDGPSRGQNFSPQLFPTRCSKRV